MLPNKSVRTTDLRPALFEHLPELNDVVARVDAGSGQEEGNGMIPNTSDEGERLRCLGFSWTRRLVEHPATCQHNSRKTVAWRRLNL